jgi:hypothetical protein
VKNNAYLFVCSVHMSQGGAALFRAGEDAQFHAIILRTKIFYISVCKKFHIIDI